jgi:hypothetical protein
VAAACAVSPCLAACGGSRSAGQCVGPQLRLAVSGRDAPRLQVTGRFFGTDCPDTNHSPPASPMRGIRVALVQGDQVVEVATVDAHGTRGEFSAMVSIPPGFAPGPALVTADTARAEVTLGRLEPGP